MGMPYPYILNWFPTLNFLNFLNWIYSRRVCNRPLYPVAVKMMGTACRAPTPGFAFPLQLFNSSSLQLFNFSTLKGVLTAEVKDVVVVILKARGHDFVPDNEICLKLDVVGNPVIRRQGDVVELLDSVFVYTVRNG